MSHLLQEQFIYDRQITALHHVSSGYFRRDTWSIYSEDLKPKHLFLILGPQIKVKMQTSRTNSSSAAAAPPVEGLKAETMLRWHLVVKTQYHSYWREDALISLLSSLKESFYK